jgi:hypothetical protein
MPTKPRSPEQRRQRRRADLLHRRLTKKKAFAHYGSKCKCGFSDTRALSIDHIDGFSQLWPGQRRGYALYLWLIKHKFPKGFQLLCMNCQWIKRFENRECGGYE